MQYYRINYRRTRNWTDYKLTSSELGVTDAMRKTKLKASSITEVFELSEHEYMHYKQLQNERKERELSLKKDNFINY